MKVSYFRFLISNLLESPLFAGSFIMVVGSNVTNLLNYIYHLIMGRLLGPASYGELSAIFSLSILLGIVPTSFSLAIVKYVSAAKSDKDIKSIVSWFNEKIFLVAMGIFLIILVGAPLISSFLNITNYFLVTIIGGGFIFSLPALLNRSILQGLLKFKQMVISVLAENGLKLILGVILVYLGFSVGGALIGLVLATASGWFISRIAISDYISGGKLKVFDFKPLFLYSIPVLVQSIAMASLYSTDLILVKHFFSSHDAGIYASLSTLGKIIFFGAGPIGAVMFPLVAKKQSRGENYKGVFNLSLLLTVSLALVILFIYWLAPEFAVRSLYGSLYLEGANLLVWFGIFITLFTLSFLITSYCLSIGRTRVVILPSLASIIQIIGIWVYHSNLMMVIAVSIIVNALLLLSLLIYSTYGNKVGIGHSSGI